MHLPLPRRLQGDRAKPGHQGATLRGGEERRQAKLVEGDSGGSGVSTSCATDLLSGLGEVTPPRPASVSPAVNGSDLCVTPRDLSPKCCAKSQMPPLTYTCWEAACGCLDPMQSSARDQLPLYSLAGCGGYMPLALSPHPRRQHKRGQAPCSCFMESPPRSG